MASERPTPDLVEQFWSDLLPWFGLGVPDAETSAHLKQGLRFYFRAAEQAAAEREREAIAAWLREHPTTPANRNRDECIALQILDRGKVSDR